MCTVIFKRFNELFIPRKVRHSLMCIYTSVLAMCSITEMPKITATLICLQYIYYMYIKSTYSLKVDWLCKLYLSSLSYVFFVFYKSVYYVNVKKRKQLRRKNTSVLHIFWYF